MNHYHLLEFEQSEFEGARWHFVNKNFTSVHHEGLPFPPIERLIDLTENFPARIDGQRGPRNALWLNTAARKQVLVL